MKRQLGLSLLAMVGVGLFLVSVPVREVAGCDCAPPPPPREALQKSAAVFLAKVVKIEDDPALAVGRRVKLAVERWWKGGDSPTITVSTSKSSAICGYGFREGERYLVYAFAERDSKVLLVSLCSRTCTFEQANAGGDLKELGMGTPPAAKP